ncbi:MAG: GTP 3',8-cyclase MoaA [Anaeromyxobacteraceae bacterium]
MAEEHGASSSPLVDGFGRRLEYLRLSVTERCNFRCAYCLPQGCPKGTDDAPLSLAEVRRLLAAFSTLGFRKVRLTGGEPTLRPDVLELVAAAAGAPGVEHVGLTTNGYRLRSIARELAAAGLTCLNVSVDSLDPERFAALTGVGRLDPVIAGVEAALEAGIPRIKVNAVLLRSTDEGELERFLGWARDVPITIRFIELMQAGDAAFFKQHHLPASVVEGWLEARGFRPVPREGVGGPSTDWAHPGHRGRIGLIAPYARGFCTSCNRLRVSSTGNLKLCLFADREIPLRPLLAADDQRGALVTALRAAVGAKPPAHALAEGRTGNVRNLAAIGG